MRVRSPILAVFLLVLAAAPGCDRGPDPALAVARVQLVAAQLPLLTNDAAGGNADAFKSLADMRARGNELRIRVKADAAKRHGFDVAWAQLDSDVDKVLKAKTVATSFATVATDLDSKMAVLGSRLDEVVKPLSERPNTAIQILVAMRERLLLDRMGRRIGLMRTGGEESQSAADGLQRDTQFFGAVIDGLCNGNDDLNLKPMSDATALRVAKDVRDEWATLQPSFRQLLDAVPALQDLRQAADSVTLDSQTVVLQAETLMQEPR